MKKTILCLVILFTILSCRKDENLPDVKYGFEVKAIPEQVEAGIETFNVVPLKFVFTKKYERGIDMQYSLVTTSKFSATDKNNNKAIELNKWYSIEKDTLQIDYKGEEQGKHEVKLLFKNSKEYQVTKIVPLNFTPNKGFIVEENFITKIDDVYQGQDITYELKIKPIEKTSDTYEIQILEFDIHNNSKIILDNETIFLNKWYSVTPENLYKITLVPYTTGLRKFKYQIRNSKGESRVVEKELNIKSSHISLDNLVLVTNELWINEPFKIEGQVTKTNPNSKNIEYKTWISKGDENAINATKTYRIYTLDATNLFSTELTATSVGNYTLNIQARDEFGNESGVKNFDIKIESRITIENSIGMLVGNRPYEFPFEFDWRTDKVAEYDGYAFNVKAKAGTKTKLVKMIISVEAPVNYYNKYYRYNQEFDLGYVDNIDKNIFYRNSGYFKYNNYENNNVTYKVKIFDNQGNVIEKSYILHLYINGGGSQVISIVELEYSSRDINRNLYNFDELSTAKVRPNLLYKYP